MDEKERKIQILQEKVKELKKSQTIKDSEIINLKDQIISLKKDNKPNNSKELNHRLQVLQTEVKRFVREKEELKEKNKSLENEIEKFKKNTVTSESLNSVQKENISLKDENSKLKNENDSFQVKLKDLMSRYSDEIKNNEKNNYIIAKYKILKENIKKETQILNYNQIDDSFVPKELQDNCEIFINGKKIQFSFTYKFEKEGIYEIKFNFTKKLTNASFMFYYCLTVISIDLSNFNASLVTDMTGMFNNCTL